MAFVLTLLVAPRTLAQATGCEGSAPEVATVTFAGNRAVPSQTLEAAVETVASSSTRRFTRLVGTRRCLAPGALLRDVARLMLLYRRKGYPRVTVDTAVERTPARALRVRFTIREHAPMLVDSVEVRGVADSAMLARVRDGVKLRPGDPLDRFSLEASRGAIVAGLRRAGYLTATAVAGERADSARLRAVAWIEVTTGARVRLGEVRVDARGLDDGEPRIPPARVRRMTRLEPGKVLGTQELADARQRLDAAGIFDEVRVSLDSIRSPPVGDAIADVNVSVAEGTSNDVHLKVGYATLDCIRLQLQAGRAAVFDRPGRFEATMKLSKVAVGSPLDFAPGICSNDVRADPYSDRLNYYLGGTYAVPASGRHRWAKSVTLYSERRSEYLAYRRTTYIGGAGSLTRVFSRRWSGAISYDLSFAGTEAEAAVLCATFSACLESDRAQVTEPLPFGLASLLATFDDTDVPLDPTRGKSLRLELRVAPRWLGTAVRQQVAGARFNAAAYYPLAKRTVLALRAQGGVVATIAGGSFIPQDERLFAGGAMTVRGFNQNEIGARVYLADSVRTVVMGDTLFWAFPPDSTPWRAVPTGGNASAVANVELRVRPSVLTEFIQFVAFVDAGNVWVLGSDDDLSNTPLFVTPGVGVRLSTPVGPIRLDVAWNAYAPPQGPAYRDVAVGYETAPLYCVSEGNTLPVTGFGQTDSQGRPLPPVQAEGPCPSTFKPGRPSGFFDRLTVTFSIGQAF